MHIAPQGTGGGPQAASHPCRGGMRRCVEEMVVVLVLAMAAASCTASPQVSRGSGAEVSGGTAARGRRSVVRSDALPGLMVAAVGPASI